MLDEDPDAILQALVGALREGASPADVARAVAFAAALRIAHFGTSNDHSDWESAHHTFSYANGAFGLIARATDGGSDVDTEALCVRAALHGALAVYLNRYLNVPPARLPRLAKRVQDGRRVVAVHDQRLPAAGAPARRERLGIVVPLRRHALAEPVHVGNGAQ